MKNRTTPEVVSNLEKHRTTSRGAAQDEPVKRLIIRKVESKVSKRSAHESFAPRKYHHPFRSKSFELAVAMPNGQVAVSPANAEGLIVEHPAMENSDKSKLGEFCRWGLSYRCCPVEPRRKLRP